MLQSEYQIKIKSKVWSCISQLIKNQLWQQTKIENLVLKSWQCSLVYCYFYFRYPCAFKTGKELWRKMYTYTVCGRSLRCRQHIVYPVFPTALYSDVNCSIAWSRKAHYTGCSTYFPISVRRQWSLKKHNLKVHFTYRY